MKKYKRIIFVCETGTARAHMAAEIMRREYTKKDIEIYAKGLIVHFPEPLNEKAEAVMISNGINVSGLVAEPLLKDFIDADTLIVVMDAGQKAKVIQDFGADKEKVCVIPELLGETGDILDPYGAPLIGYGKCFEEIEAYIKRYAYKLIVEG